MSASANRTGLQQAALLALAAFFLVASPLQASWEIKGGIGPGDFDSEMADQVYDSEEGGFVTTKSPGSQKGVGAYLGASYFIRDRYGLGLRVFGGSYRVEELKSPSGNDTTSILEINAGGVMVMGTWRLMLGRFRPYLFAGFGGQDAEVKPHVLVDGVEQNLLELTGGPYAGERFDGAAFPFGLGVDWVVGNGWLIGLCLNMVSYSYDEEEHAHSPIGLNDMGSSMSNHGLLTIGRTWDSAWRKRGVTEKEEEEEQEPLLAAAPEDRVVRLKKLEDYAEMVRLVDDKELRIEGGEAKRTSVEMRWAKSVVREETQDWKLDIVDEKGKVVRSYHYRRGAAAELKPGTDELSLDIVDAGGVVLDTLQLRAGTKPVMREEKGAVVLEIVDDAGKVLESRLLRAGSKPLLRGIKDSWTVDVVDKGGKVLETRRVRAGEVTQMRWGEEMRGVVVAAGARLSYRMRSERVPGEIRELQGPVLSLSGGEMFSLPGGRTVPGLAGAGMGFLAGMQGGLREAQMVVSEKESGKEVRHIDLGAGLPEAIGWDGRNDKGKPVPSDREYTIRIGIVDGHGNAQTVARDISMIDARVSGMSEDEAELVFRSAGMRFDYNDVVLKEEEYLKMRKIVETSRANPDIRITVEGHSDDLGEDKYNRLLSKKRALVVLKHLVEREKLPVQRLAVKACGSDFPMASNLTAAGRAENRRVELVMHVPLKVAGMSRKEARKIVTELERAPVLKKGQKIALVSFPGGAEGERAYRKLGELLAEQKRFKLIEEKKIAEKIEGSDCHNPECWAEIGRKLKTDWVMCAAESRERKTRFLVVELVHAKTGRAVFSESVVLGEGQWNLRNMVKRVAKALEGGVSKK